MPLDWRQRAVIDAPRYARISDGSSTYCAVLPGDVGLMVACEDYQSASRYTGYEGELVACVALLIESGKEIERLELDVPCRSAK